jgi:NADH-quinone oxidoreductase subunit N
MAAFLVSLAGIPPTAGFWAKFVIFEAAIVRGDIGPWLAGIMVVNSIISLGYYLGVVRQMFLVEAPTDRRPAVPALVTALAVLGAIAVVVVFVYPDLLARFPESATLFSP